MSAQVNVMQSARAIGLIAADGSDVFGTIERQAVLDVLADLAAKNVIDADLFADAAARVSASRSAGVEKVGVTDFLGRGDVNGVVQLSYRSEMAAIFLDLAIDLGLRHSASPSPAPADA
jgi:hypothetical protein